MCRKSIYLILFVLVVVTTSGQAEVTPVTSVVITRVENPGGAPNFWLESITVGSYTVTVDELVTGVSEGAATAQPAPYNDIRVADNFDLNLFAGRDNEVPPTHQIKELGGKSVWTDTNRDNPDFFLFETGGNQDFSIEAILPGGVIGQSVNVPQSTFGDTGLVITTSGPHNGQTIEGVAFAITDLLDQNGDNLTNNSEIEGIQISSPGYDPSGFYASVGGPVVAASGPDPADGVLYADTWVNLSWAPGDFAVSHDVYFSDNFNDVNDGAESAFLGNQAGTFFVAGFPGFPYPEGLVPGTTYYWRIDEVNDTEPNSPWKGDVWSFIVPPRIAYNPDPADGAEFVGTDVSLSWTGGFGAKLHHVYFGDNFDDVNNAAVGIPSATNTYTPGTLEVGKTYFWRIDEFDGVATYKGDVWSFSTLPVFPITDPNFIGWWKLDEDYGTIAIDWSGYGNHGTLANGPQWVEGYDGSALLFDGEDDSVEISNFVPPVQGTISFWINPASVGPRGRIFGGADEFEAYVEDNILASQLFAAGSAPNYLTSNATILTDTWTHVALTYDGISHLLQIYLNGSLDGENSTADDIWNGGAFAFAHRAGRDQEYYHGLLDDFRIYNIVLTQEEIKKTMRGDPLLAWDPKPSNGSTPYIKDAAPLNWSPGDNASQHDVYFGTDRDAVTNADETDTTGIYRGRRAATSYNPPEGIEWGGGPYYWRIDEYNTDGTINTGRIWSFTIADFIVIDDFEDYDVGNNEIWWVWIDGLGYPVHPTKPPHPGNGTGSMVGDETSGSYMEETIVHGGGKSMPVFYDNNQQGKLRYSEVEKTLSSRRDWTEQGVGVLSLWFYGVASNAAEPLYVALNGNAVVTHDNPDAAQIEAWTEWTIELQLFADQGVNLANVNTIAIGLGNKKNPFAGGSGTMYFDDIRLYRPTP